MSREKPKGAERDIVSPSTPASLNRVRHMSDTSRGDVLTQYTSSSPILLVCIMS